MSFDEEIEKSISGENEFLMKKDPLEKLKQKLRKKQETIQSVEDHPYVDIIIPATGKIGEECVVKISKKVPNVEMAISQEIRWEKRDKFDKTSKPELICVAFLVKKEKNTDKIKQVWEDIGILHQKPTNLLQEGEYMVEVRAWNNEAWEETTARRLVKITK